jgi:hypothetical protein
LLRRSKVLALVGWNALRALSRNGSRPSGNRREVFAQTETRGDPMSDRATPTEAQRLAEEYLKDETAWPLGSSSRIAPAVRGFAVWLDARGVRVSASAEGPRAPSDLDLKGFAEQYTIIGHLCNGEKYRPYSHVLCSLCGPGKVYEVVRAVDRGAPSAAKENQNERR